MYKKLLSIFVILLLSAFCVRAQNAVSGTDRGNALEYVPGAVLDSTLYGKSIFSLLPSKGKGDRAEVAVHQSQAIQDALNQYVSANVSRKITGYRVRIFNDNKQTARGASEAALHSFKSMYPGVSAYRSYTNPFFKVTVGDFRTKSEAMHLLQAIRRNFPRAFIVKESIRYPSMGSGSAALADVPAEQAK